MPNANYAVVASASAPGNGVNVFTRVRNQTATGFQVFCLTSDPVGALDSPFSVVVHATNATLPNSFTEDQIQNVVDLAQSGATNPGASAWASVSETGVIEGGMNIASVTKVETGKYNYVFTNPMPDNNYAIVGSSDTPGGVKNLGYDLKTTTGFRVTIFSISTNSQVDAEHNIAVFATNALPLKGGAGADAWASTLWLGDTESSYNLSVQSNTTGVYEYTFNTPMPNNKYAVATSVIADVTSPRFLSVISKSNTGFTVTVVNENGSPITQSHSVVVHATNAVLPETITQEQLTGVLGAFTREGTDVTLANIDDNVGIGTTSPGQKLVVADDGETTIVVSNNPGQDIGADTAIIRKYADDGGLEIASCKVSGSGQLGNAQPIKFYTSLGLNPVTINATGIAFDSGTSNTLDDYEEGTWTPMLSAENLGTGNFVPNSPNGGFYTKIGKVVFFQFNLSGTWTNGTASGTAQILNLPFLVAGPGDRPGNSAYAPVAMPYADGFDHIAGIITTGGLCFPGTSTLRFYAQNNIKSYSVGIQVCSEIPNGVNIHGSGSYEVA